MKINYDPEVDALSVRLSEGKIAESDQVHPGVILDYDEEDNVVAIEILHAKKRTEDLLRIARTFSAWVEGLASRESLGVTPEELELLRALRSLPEEVRNTSEQAIREQARERSSTLHSRPARRA